MPTEILRPIGNLSANLLTGFPTSNNRNYNHVDEVTPNDAADYAFTQESFGNNITFRDEYTLADPVAIGATDIINSVTLRYRGLVSTSGTVKRYRVGFKNGSGGAEDFDSYRSTTSWTTFTKVYAVSPFTGLAWTLAGLIALASVPEVNVQGSPGVTADGRVTWIEAAVDFTPVPKAGGVNRWNRGNFQGKGGAWS